MPITSKTPKERFLEKIKKDPITGCWEWVACTDRDGYGQFKIKGKQYKSHRVSYDLFVVAIKPGMFICHKCDNPSCVNPDHLFQGSPKDNTHDSMKKGRKPAPPTGYGFKKGAPSMHRLLSEDTIRKIRQDLNNNNNLTQTQIGRKWSVSRRLINSINCGKSYANVT